MKYILLIGIFFTCGIIGYSIKTKYKEQKMFLEFIEDFVNFLFLNISIYKNNIDEIITSYLIQQKNKNAKYTKIFIKNNNLWVFNKKIVDDYIYEESYKMIILSFLDSLGKQDIESECEKIKNFRLQINNCIEKTKEELHSKGELYFKLFLTLGVVIDIVLW